MIEVLGDRLLVQPSEKNENYDDAGLLQRPDIARERPCEGTVLQVGPSVATCESVEDDEILKVGTQILYGKFAGTEIEIEGEECLIMKAEEVMGVRLDDEPQPGLVHRRKREGIPAAPEPAAAVEEMPTKPSRQCPHCSKTVTDDHTCPQRNFELVAYDELTQPMWDAPI